jgi:hypothetical protein
MAENGMLQGAGSSLPTVERRSGEDRRKADSQDFFARGGIDRRSGVEARKNQQKRENGNPVRGRPWQNYEQV